MPTWAKRKDPSEVLVKLFTLRVLSFLRKTVAPETKVPVSSTTLPWMVRWLKLCASATGASQFRKPAEWMGMALMAATATRLPASQSMPRLRWKQALGMMAEVRGSSVQGTSLLLGLLGFT